MIKCNNYGTSLVGTTPDLLTDFYTIASHLCEVVIKDLESEGFERSAEAMAKKLIVHSVDLAFTPKEELERVLNDVDGFVDELLAEAGETHG